jgi:hypothetical protein
MPQRIVIRRSEDVISEADAIARHIVLSEEAKCLSSITQVGNGGSGSVFALHFKNGTVEERVQSKTPNHVKPSFTLISLTYIRVLLGR